MKMSFGIRVGQIILTVCRPIIFMLFPYKMIGLDRIPKTTEAFVVCCNHISMVDPVFLLLGLRRPVYFMAKDSLFKNAFVGWLLRTLFGVFPVARGKKDSGAVETSISILESGRVLGIFPEGTRSKDGKLGPAKSGTGLIVAKTGANVLPCAAFTKTGQVKLFKRTTIVFGEMLTPEVLHLDGEKPDLRYASRTLMAIISDMIEENR